MTTRLEPNRDQLEIFINAIFRHAKAGLFRELAAARTDPMLFGLSYDYVGDLAETVALIWPQRPNDSPPPDLATIVETLEVSPKAKLPEIVADWLDRLDATVGVRLFGHVWSPATLLTGPGRMPVA